MDDNTAMVLIILIATGYFAFKRWLEYRAATQERQENP